MSCIEINKYKDHLTISQKRLVKLLVNLFVSRNEMKFSILIKDSKYTNTDLDYTDKSIRDTLKLLGMRKI